MSTVLKPFGILVLLASTMACGGSSTSPSTSSSTTTTTTATVSTVTVSGTTSLTPSVLTTQLTATATLSDSTTQDVTSQATWTSSNTAVASVSSAGLVTAVTDGAATMTATYQSVSGTLTVAVNNVSNCPFGTSAHGSMSATINGVPWKSGCVTVAELMAGTGALHISGANTFTLVGQTIDIQLSNPAIGTVINDPARATPILGQLLVGGSQGASWSTASGSATMTITSLTSAGASGTFDFSLSPATSAAMGLKSVANGVFNVTF